MKINRIAIISVGCVLMSFQSYSQDILDKLSSQSIDTTFYTAATFKMTRLSIGHSLETRKKGVLEFYAHTRYWNTFSDRSTSFAADKMTASFGLDYAFTDIFTAGVSFTSLSEQWAGFLKYRVLRQKPKSSIIGVTLLQNITYRSSRFTPTQLDNSVIDRATFTTQVLLGSKISKNFSFQIVPSLIIRGSKAFDNDPAIQGALGFGGRYKVGNHVSLVSEYYYVVNKIESRTTYGAFALGANWEVGDVLLQFQLTNARIPTTDSFITETPFNFNFKNGYLVFGFNATYVFHF